MVVEAELIDARGVTVASGVARLKVIPKIR
jgi:hypothetical protein